MNEYNFENFLLWFSCCLLEYGLFELNSLYDGNVGFVIPGRKILTNAHVVADYTFVLVRKHGSPTKYRAEVQAVGHECDLAILVVESEEFWEGMTFLELGDIPFLQEAVAVVGYPQGNAIIYFVMYNSCNLCHICFVMNGHVS